MSLLSLRATAHRADFRRLAKLGLPLLWLFLAAAVAQAGMVREDVTGAIDAVPLPGTLVTNNDMSSITGDTVASWISQYIPPTTQVLLVLTECYGGNFATSFATLPNVAVISGTSPGQPAYNFFYNSAAAAALKPADGTTAQTVQDAGAAGKNPRETPTTGGGLPPSDFSLADTDPTGDVQGRYILDYAGQPITSMGQQVDVVDRNTIQSNFSGQYNTTFTSIGDSGQNGWDYSATAEDLRAQIENVGQQINSSDLAINKQQVIIFVGDHGGLDFTHILQNTAVAPKSTVTIPDMEELTTPELGCPQVLADNPSADPGFTVFVDLYASGVTHAVADGPLFSPGDWSMEIDTATGSYTLTDFTEQPLDLDGDGILGDSAGEGVTLFFPVAGTEMEDDFLDGTYNMTVINNTDQTWVLDEADEVTGPIGPAQVPEPAAGGAALALVGLTLWRRKD